MVLPVPWLSSLPGSSHARGRTHFLKSHLPGRRPGLRGWHSTAMPCPAPPGHLHPPPALAQPLCPRHQPPRGLLAGGHRPAFGTVPAAAGTRRPQDKGPVVPRTEVAELPLWQQDLHPPRASPVRADSLAVTSPGPRGAGSRRWETTRHHRGGQGRACRSVHVRTSVRRKKGCERWRREHPAQAGRQGLPRC